MSIRGCFDLEEFEYLGVVFALLMAGFFVLGWLGGNPILSFISLLCAIACGVLVDGYPRDAFVWDGVN
jgi:hypothetical protein